ncbi:MAG: CPBP family intramembrane metalloprotease [Myxococcales bacterium]|nr:CPBP family intramembrane metalloprotease [Myxococcales bacterium]
MRCPACGADHRPGARFCRRCGEPFTPGDARPVSAGAGAGAGAGASASASASAGAGASAGTGGPESLGSPSRRALAAWRTLTPLFWLMVLLLGSSGFVVFASRAHPEHTATYELAAALVDAAIIAAFALGERRALAPLLGRHAAPGRSALYALAAVACIFAFMELYFLALGAFGVEELRFLDHYRAAGWPTWAVFAFVSGLPAVVEELAFRGYVWTRLERVVGPRDALVIQAAMFSVLHLMPLVFLSHFAIGLVLGLVRLRTKSLYPGMAAHAAWNAIVVLEELL